MPTVTIGGVRKVSGSVLVHFVTERDPEFYYCHSIWGEGSESDSTMDMSMWAWVNHMREKNWWTPDLEQDFITRVRKVLS